MNDKPQPQPPICDFCNEPNPTWWFPCKDYQMTVRVPGDLELTPQQQESFDIFTHLLGIRNIGDWAACDTCKDLIIKGQRDTLAVRSAKLFRRHHPEASHLTLKAITESMRASQDDFWSHRLGDPHPI